MGAHLEQGCSADAAVLVDTDFIGSCRNLSLCCLVVTEQGRVCIFMMIGCSITIVFPNLMGDENLVRELGDEILWVYDYS